MKILKYILLGLPILIVLVVIGLIIFLKNFDINRYKPQIVQQASSVLGRPMNVEKLALALSLRGGIALNLQGLAVHDDPMFQTGNLLEVNSVDVGVDAWHWIMTREIHVTQVLVHSPRVNLIRTQQGVINIQKMGSQAQGPALAASPNPSSPSSPAPTASKPANIPVVTVDKIEVKDASLNFTDQSFSPALVVNLTNVQARVLNFSLQKPFPIVMSGRFLSEKNNLQVKGGSVKLDISQPSVALSNIRVEANLAEISPAMVQQTLGPLLRGITLQEIDGRLMVNFEEATAGATGLTSLDLNGELKEGKFKVKELATPIEAITAKFLANAKDFSLPEFSAKAASGTLKAQGTISDYLGAQNFSFQKSAEGIRLGELIDQSHQPVRIEGQLFGIIEAQGQGLNPDSILKNLSGTGTLEIKEGRLVDFNVLRMVLDKMSMLPQLVEKIQQNLPARYQQILQQKDTILEKVQINSSITDGGLNLQDFKFESLGFLLTGSGNIGFDQTLDLKTTLAMAQDLSQAMVEAVSEMQLLQESDGQIRFPVLITGKLSAPIALPDLEYLSKRIFTNRGRQEIEKVLDKVFGQGKGEKSGEPPGNTEMPQKEPSRKAIDSILDSIFK